MKMKKTHQFKLMKQSPLICFEVNELVRPNAQQINNELTVVRDLGAM